MNINEMFETLAADNSRNFKIDYLKSNSDNKLFKKVITLALDPFTNFYIRKIPNYVPAQRNQADSLDSVLDSLEMLSSRQLTGNAGIEHLTKLLSSLSEDDAKVVEKIIGKDLKCGVSISTVNKVWKNLIKEYPCMLCSQYEQRLVDKIIYPAIVNEKYDGTRFNCIIKNGIVEFRSRNGKLFDLLGNLEKEFLSISNNEDVVFDGELLYDDSGIANRQTGNGIIGKSIKGTISQEESSNVTAMIWDIIDYNDFVIGESNIPYKDRFAKLQKISFPNKINLTSFNLVYNIESAMEIYEEYLKQGKEGIILKDMNKGWSNKRVNHQIKVKNELVCELKVVGSEWGEGKYSDKLGNIICQSEDGIINVSVGSGFTDLQREEYKGDILVGSIISVKYNARIRNKNNEESLFLPIFQSVREDKDFADYSSSIK